MTYFLEVAIMAPVMATSHYAPNVNVFQNRLDHFRKHTQIKYNYKTSHVTSLRLQQLADVATMSGT